MKPTELIDLAQEGPQEGLRALLALQSRRGPARQVRQSLYRLQRRECVVRPHRLRRAHGRA